MITALGTKPNILHAVRAMKPAHNKTWAQGSAALSRKTHNYQVTSALNQQTNSSSLGSHGMGAVDGGGVASLLLALSLSLSRLYWIYHVFARSS